MQLTIINLRLNFAHNKKVFSSIFQLQRQAELHILFSWDIWNGPKAILVQCTYDLDLVLFQAPYFKQSKLSVSALYIQCITPASLCYHGNRIGKNGIPFLPPLSTKFPHIHCPHLSPEWRPGTTTTAVLCLIKNGSSLKSALDFGSQQCHFSHKSSAWGITSKPIGDHDGLS